MSSLVCDDLTAVAKHKFNSSIEWLRLQFTVNIVFLSMTKMPNTLNPIGSPFRRLRNTFTCTHLPSNKLSILKRRPQQKFTRPSSNDYAVVTQYSRNVTQCRPVREKWFLHVRFQWPWTDFLPFNLKFSPVTCAQGHVFVFTKLKLSTAFRWPGVNHMHGTDGRTNSLNRQIEGLRRRCATSRWGYD